MFSDKTKSYFLADSITSFMSEFQSKKELVKQFPFGEVIFKLHSSNIYAFKNKCPHQGAKLNGCSIVEGKIICPLHHYKFDIEHGRGHGMYLQTYPLEEKADGFYLLRTYFSWFGE